MDPAQNVQSAIVRNLEQGIVQFGAIVDGVFHSFGATRIGDFDDAHAAALAAQPQPVTPSEPVAVPAEG